MHTQRKHHYRSTGTWSSRQQRSTHHAGEYAHARAGVQAMGGAQAKEAGVCLLLFLRRRHTTWVAKLQANNGKEGVNGGDVWDRAYVDTLIAADGMGATSTSSWRC